MTGTGLEVDPLVWADTYQDLHCEHGNHNKPGWAHHHQGPATHYALVVHNCQANPNAGTIYPVCTPFSQYVNAMADQPWMCWRCKETNDGRDMVRILCLIDH
jgi:carboxypeptidase C (cathepsin A)